MYTAAAAWLVTILASLALGIGLVVPLPAAIVFASLGVVALGATIVAAGSFMGARRLGESFASAAKESLREGARWLFFFIP